MRAVIQSFVLLISFALAADSQADSPRAAEMPAEKPTLDTIKKFVGEWFAVGEDGQPTDQLVSVYRVTAGGSAVHETLFPGQDHEMITVYHQDGEDLVLSHYCVLGNQPRMKASPDSTDRQITFEFTGGANINVEQDAHMHQGVVKIIDDNTLETAWTQYAEGKPAEVVKFTLKRKTAN